jgi:hypothetical protein
MSDQSEQSAARRPAPPQHGRVPLYTGIAAAIPPLVYTGLILALGDEASTVPGGLLRLLMPFVFGSVFLGPLSLVVAIYTFVRFLRSRAPRMRFASFVWFVAAIAYAFTAYDFTNRLRDIERLLPPG